MRAWDVSGTVTFILGGGGTEEREIKGRFEGDTSPDDVVADVMLNDLAGRVADSIEEEFGEGYVEDYHCSEPTVVEAEV